MNHKPSDEYSWAEKNLDAEYKHENLDDVSKLFRNFHVEAQHQLRKLPQ
jgi:hypothetical protein